MKSKLTINADGTKLWSLNGQFHRDDGPAIEFSDGTKFWYLNGELHREDGPAEEWSDGTKIWYLNGKWHRENGPAMEDFDGSKWWYLNDKLLTKEQLISEKMKINYLEIYKSYLIYQIMDS